MDQVQHTMSEPHHTSDTLEEIDDPSDLLSRPLEPIPLVPPPSEHNAAPVQSPQRRQLPPGYGTSASTSSSTSNSMGVFSSRPAVWNPSSSRVQTAASHAPPPQQQQQQQQGAAHNSLVIDGSGARVPTQFLDSSGGFSRPKPPHGPSGSAGPPAASAPPAASPASIAIPGAYPQPGSSSSMHIQQRHTKPSMAAAKATPIDLTLSSDEEDDVDDRNPPLPARMASTGSAPASSSSAGARAVVPIDDDDDDDDEVTLVSHKRPDPEEFEIDHVKSNAIVCAGLINAVVLCIHGIPPALTYNGSIGQEPPEDPNLSRENWPTATHFWIEKGYRPLLLTLSNPANMLPSTRTLPGGWSYTAMPQARRDINVSVIVPPRTAHPSLSLQDALAQGHVIEASFGALADKYVVALEPLLRQNKIRCETRCRMVPVGRAQNFLHYLEILVFTRRPDLGLVSDQLSANGIQLEHPPSYHPEDYPTEPQYTNPHNPPAGGMRNDPGIYNGIYRGAGIGTSVQNRELTEKEKKAQVDAIYSSIRSGEELAAVEPSHFISTRLLQHQKQALGFLLNREKDRRWPELLLERDEAAPEAAKTPPKEEKPSPDVKGKKSSPGSSASLSQKDRGKKKDDADEDSISLWKVRKGVNGNVRAWRNLITNRETLTQPRICRGAILADDMGLGKTITTLALIAHTLSEAKAFGSAKVQRDAGAELQVAMQLCDTSNDKSSPGKAVGGVKAEAASGSNGKTDKRKRQASESSFEDDELSCTDTDEETDTSGSMSMAVHNAPPATKKASTSKPRGRKSKKDKADPEKLRRQHLECRSRATLIVCPLSVISNWEEQFKEHWTRRKRPSIYIYHGPSRATNAKWIANHDIVLTTYSTLGSEFANQTTWVTDDSKADGKKRGGNKGGNSSDDDNDGHEDDVLMVNGNGIPLQNEAGKNGKKRRRKPAKEAYNPLQRIEWFRVVLDEAHQIKGALTWQSKAACNLTAQRRLCLTGTPIQNTIDDLFALVKFLRLDPFTERAMWNEFCGHRESTGLKSKKDDEPIDSANLGHVQILMKFLALRRQKTTKTADGKPLLALPPKLSKTEYLDFEEAEKARYQALHNLYREDFEEMMAKDTVNNNYATILTEILNLRMTCDHPSLVDASKDARRRAAGADLSEAIKQDGLSRERAAILFLLFRDSEMAYCSECQSPVSPGSDRDRAGNDARDLADALDVAAADGRGSTKRARTDAASESTSAAMSRNGLETPAEGAARPVLTRCQHLYCAPCFRRLIGYPWPEVSASDVGHCPTCNYSLKLAIDAVELHPSDFVDIYDDQGELAADGERFSEDEGVSSKGKAKSGKNEAEDFFDWGSGDEEQPSKPKAQRKNGASTADPSTVQRGDLSLEGRKDVSTKIRALITDLLPFSKCNPHSALYDPMAPRLVHVDPTTSDEAEVRAAEEPVVVVQRPPLGVKGEGLLGKLDQTMEAIESVQDGPGHRGAAGLAACRWHGSEPRLGLPRLPDGPVLEPGGGEPGPGPRAPHGSNAAGDHDQVHHAPQHRGEHAAAAEAQDDARRKGGQQAPDRRGCGRERRPGAARREARGAQDSVWHVERRRGSVAHVAGTHHRTPAACGMSDCAYGRACQIGVSLIARTAIVLHGMRSLVDFCLRPLGVSADCGVKP
ncbi:hypothetical protein L1887_48006 [Cichorium endivia]|nr:hypothetical protein L1887_48006 [Cichorium endivia]